MIIRYIHTKRMVSNTVLQVYSLKLSCFMVVKDIDETIEAIKLFATIIGHIPVS